MARPRPTSIRIPAGTIPPTLGRGSTSGIARQLARWERAVRAARIAAKTGKGAVHVVRFGHRNRRRLAPVYLAAGTLTTGAALWAGHRGAQATAVIATGTALVLTVKATRARRRGERWSRRRTVTTLATYLAAMLWLLTVSEVGLDRPMLTTLLAGAILGFGVPWWWHHRVRPEPEVVVETPEATEADKWATRVATIDGALPGSWLTNPRPLGDDWGFAALINLVQGKQTIETAQAATGRIASAFGVPVSSVTIVPTEAAGAHQANLEIWTRNPLQDVNDWPGPNLLDMATGMSPIGVHPDGSTAMYQWFGPGSGPVMDLISGATGSGKSQLLGMLLAYERHNGFVSVVIDPQEGQSLHEWGDDPDSVNVFARSTEEGLLVLRALRAVLLGRNRQLARKRWTDKHGRQRRGVGSFVHSPEMPLIVITIDEAHMILRAYPEAVSICEDIAKMGRKCGIKLRLATQVPLLIELGGSNTLREQLAAGNVIVLRTGGRISGQVAFQGALPVDPFMLPRRWPDGSSTAGLGYLLSAHLSEAMLRTYRLDDGYGWATSGTPGVLESRAEALLAPLREKFRARFDSDDDIPLEAPTVLAQVAATRTIKQRIVEFFTNRSGMASTGTVAQELGIGLPTASTTLDRLAQEGLVTKVQRGMWQQPVSEVEDERELEAVDA